MKGRKSAERETEIKLPVAAAAVVRRLLRCAGFRVSKPRALETNTVLDTSDRSLLRAGSLLRVRSVRGEGVLTYKGPVDNGRHKSRQEIETHLDDPEAALRILTHLEFQSAFRYQKYRTEFKRIGSRGTIMLDETPIGAYLELEGSAGWIDRTARELGFSPSDYITASYGRLYFAYCQTKGIRPGDMVYETSTSHPKPGRSPGRM
jgi:adenylate cyclase, class 2